MYAAAANLGNPPFEPWALCYAAPGMNVVKGLAAVIEQPDVILWGSEQHAASPQVGSEPVAAFWSNLSYPKTPAFNCTSERFASFICTHASNGKGMVFKRPQASELLV